MIVKNSNYPTFIGIGAKKCGTTWLSECLRYHPEVFMSAKKEIHFFGAQPGKARTLEWYLTHFRGARGYPAVGEFSPSYLQRVDAAEQILKTLGKVKIVVMLRDPVQRFISDYKHLIRAGKLPRKEFGTLDLFRFSRAIELYPELIRYGQYFSNLSKFIDLFGPANICVVVKEDVDENPNREIRRVYGFIGVNGAFVPPVIEKKVSPGIIPRFAFLESLRIRAFRIFNANSPQVVVMVRKLRLAEIYRNLNADRKPERFVVSNEVIDRLRVYYQDEIGGLENFLGRRLDNWRE